MVVDRLFAIDGHKISVGDMTVNRFNILSNMPVGLIGTSCHLPSLLLR